MLAGSPDSNPVVTDRVLYATGSRTGFLFLFFVVVVFVFFPRVNTSCRLVIACLAFVCTAHTKIVVHVKDPVSTFQ